MMVFISKVNNYMFQPIAAIFRLLKFCSKTVIYIYIYIQGVTGGTDQTSGGCSLC